MDGVRMVKVDNWAAFFLQKLQALYTRGDYCDLTLQFHTNECIKVHRLVLNTCTEYFETLIQQNNVKHHMRLPPSLQSDVVVPIINFMYSGRLEFRPELHFRLYHTAKILNMQILTKLLDTHAGPLVKPGGTTVSPSPPKFKQFVPVAPASSLLSNSRFIKCEPEPSDIIPGKRLPIWKKRTTSSSFSVNVTPRPVVDEPAKPTRFEWPEEGDAEAVPLLYSSTFDDISYDSVPIVKSVNSIVQSAVPPSGSQPLVQLSQQRVMPAATFESVYQSTNLKREAQPASDASDADPLQTPGEKKIKLDIDEVKELVQEQEVRKSLITKSDDDSEHDAEDLDDFLPRGGDEYVEEETLRNPLPITPLRGNPKPILKIHDSPDTSKETTPSKKVRFSLEPKVHTPNIAGVSGSSTSSVASAVPAPIPVPVDGTSTEFKTLATSSTSKKVVDSSGNTFEIRTSTNAKKSADGSAAQPKTANVNNHAKIIAEVLKKYPDLVKNNKNIRLKIMQKDGFPAVSVEKSGGPGEPKAKVSYMVVKADQAAKARAQLELNALQSGARNTLGPWECTTCQEGVTLKFETYYLYRKHLVEVHEEKIDCRICEHCGHKASKRNLLLYHMYKQHNIPPPPSCNFPKCDQCDHVALSDTLLAKHKNVHTVAFSLREFSCRNCNLSFKSYASLQAHAQSGTQCEPNKKYKCPVCCKIFLRQLNLKNHIRTEHADVKLLEDLGDEQDVDEPELTMSQHAALVEGQDRLMDDQTISAGMGMEQEQDPVCTQSLSQAEAQSQPQPQPEVHPQVQSQVQPQVQVQAQQATYILPPGVTILTDNNQAALMPSTEAEALSNVASGIAASLGVTESMVITDQGQHQTLILVDKNQLIQIPSAGGTEYIVPDMMTNDMGQSVGVYTSGQLSQLIQYTTAGPGTLTPVTVSTSDQGLMTVSANGSIVNHALPLPQQTAAAAPMMTLPHGQISEHNGGEIAMILTDHAYSEGMVRENGAVIQTTSVPVSMNMVPTSAVVSVVSSVGTIVHSDHNSDGGQLMISQGPVVENTVIENTVVENTVAENTTDPSHITASPVEEVEEQEELAQQAPQTQKMADIVSDWDDIEENEENCGLQRTEDPTEDAALPSRPTIVLKSDLDQDDLSDNLQMKIT